MFTLVKFDNDSFGIYPSKKISFKNNGDCTVSHNGAKYNAELISDGNEFFFFVLRCLILFSLRNERRFSQIERYTTS